jgi:SsrA-binding protein
MAKQKPEDADRRVICRNRKAVHEFEILDAVECGLVLVGTEVKSLREGKASLEGAFARVEDGAVWLYRAEIPEYAMGNRMNHEPKRKRKLLLHRSQIARFAAAVAQKGSTLIPLQIYFNGSRAKLELAIARGKKLHDKRETLKSKTAKREMDRATGVKRGRNG